MNLQDKGKPKTDRNRIVFDCADCGQEVLVRDLNLRCDPPDAWASEDIRAHAAICPSPPATKRKGKRK